VRSIAVDRGKPSSIIKQSLKGTEMRSPRWDHRQKDLDESASLPLIVCIHVCQRQGECTVHRTAALGQSLLFLILVDLCSDVVQKLCNVLMNSMTKRTGILNAHGMACGVDEEAEYAYNKHVSLRRRIVVKGRDRKAKDVVLDVAGGIPFFTNFVVCFEVSRTVDIGIRDARSSAALAR
jgi:hypothetical protein